MKCTDFSIRIHQNHIKLMNKSFLEGKTAIKLEKNELQEININE